MLCVGSWDPIFLGTMENRGTFKQLLRCPVSHTFKWFKRDYFCFCYDNIFSIRVLMPKKIKNKKKPLCQHLRTNNFSYFAQTIFLISRGSAMNLKKCWKICPHWKHQYSVLLQGGHGTFRKLQSCGMHLAYKNEITAEGNINVCLTSCVKCCRFFPSMVCFPAPFHGNGIRRAIPTTDFRPIVSVTSPCKTFSYCTWFYAAWKRG